MAYCSQCGAIIANGSRFCSNCGASTANTVTSALTDYSVNTLADVNDGLSVMLVSLGSCTRKAAIDLISECCGYSELETAEIVDNCPIPIAQNLSQTQAAYLSQAMAEYGMDATVYDQNGYRTLSSGLSSVFSGAGGFLKTVASVLGLIGLGNRINHKSVRRWSNPHHFEGVQPPIVRVAPRPAPVPPSIHNVRIHREPKPTPIVHESRPAPIVREPRPAPIPQKSRPAMMEPRHETPRPAQRANSSKPSMGRDTRGNPGGFGCGGMGGPMGGGR